MVSSDLIERRKSELDDFYAEVISVLVEFVEQMGIKPAPQVLTHAADYLPLLSKALSRLVLEDDADKRWLQARVAYFSGEYFAQKYKGSWYVNEVQESSFYGHYVVGRFAGSDSVNVEVDPFEVGRSYVELSIPRDLESLLDSVDLDVRSRKERVQNFPE